MLSLLRNSIFNNFSWLVINHAANALWPLLLYPFLVRTAGMERFGEFSMMLSILNILLIFIDYGFQITGVKDVVNAASKRQLNHVFSAIFLLKALLLLIIAVVTIPVVMLMFKTGVRLHIYLGLLIAIVGNLFNPIWFLVAQNIVQVVAIPNLVLRIAIVLLVFTFIKSSDSFWMIYYFTGATYFIFGMIGFFYVLVAYQLKMRLVSIKALKNEVSKGKALFISNLCIGCYSQVPVLVLGVICGNVIVGEYALGDKFILLIRQLINVFAQSIFPVACEKAKGGSASLKKLYGDVLRPLIAALLVICLLLTFFAPLIFKVATGSSHPQAVLIFRILLWLPMINAVIVPYFHSMIIFELKWKLGLLFGTAIVVSLAFSTLLAWIAASTGVAIGVLCTELYIFIAMAVIVNNSPHSLYTLKNTSSP